MSDVLVVGGTGMLAGVVDELARRGHRVLVPSRHPAAATDRIVPFQADWSDPQVLLSLVRDRLDGPLEKAVVWCHRPHRAAIVDGVRDLLAADGRLIEVLGSTTLAQLWDRRPPAESVFVMLGHKQLDDGTGRWLTHDEIGSGVVGSLDRPAGTTVVVGSLD